MPSLMFAVLALVATSQVAPSPEPVASPESQSGPILQAADTWHGEAFIPRPIRDENVRVAANIEPRAIDPNKKDELEQKVIELNQLQREVDVLRSQIGAPQQILVKVQMLEVSLTKMRKDGFDVDLMASGFMNSETARRLTAATKELDSDRSKAALSSDKDKLLAFVDWIRDSHYGKVIADPVIVTTLGRPASFNVGGEIPIPARGDTRAAVEFRPYGTKLDVVATVLGNGNVRMEIRTRVSALDDERTLDIDGVKVPGLNVRQVDTSVETADRQTVAITGLVEERTESHNEGEKIVTEENEVMMMIVVTPELVDSIASAKVGVEDKP